LVLVATVAGQHALATPIMLDNVRMRDVSLPGGVFRLAVLESQFPIFPWLSFYLAGFVAAMSGLVVDQVSSFADDAESYGNQIEDYAKDWFDADIDVDETVDCLAAGVILTRFEDVPIALLLYATDRGMTSVLVVEVVAVAAAGAATFLLRPRTGLIEPAAVDVQGYFTALQLERAEDFRTVQRLLGVGGLVVGTGTLALLAWRPPRRVFDRLARRPILGGAAAGAGISLLLVLVGCGGPRVPLQIVGKSVPIDVSFGRTLPDFAVKPVDGGVDLQFSIEDKVILRTTDKDSPLTSGTFGLNAGLSKGAGTPEDTLELEFNNFEVRELTEE
jgi:hypothetical protein